MRKKNCQGMLFVYLIVSVLQLVSIILNLIAIDTSYSFLILNLITFSILFLSYIMGTLITKMSDDKKNKINDLRITLQSTVLFLNAIVSVFLAGVLFSMNENELIFLSIATYYISYVIYFGYFFKYDYVRKELRIK